MARFGLDIALDTNPIARGGRLPEGLYISNSSGDLTYFGSGTTYEGVTFQSSYDVYWFEVDADGIQTTPVAVAGNVLVLGENAPISIVGTGTYPAISLTMYRFDTLTITSSGGTAIGTVPTIAVSISGGAWNSTRADAKTNITQSSIVNGDNVVTATQTDPNGVETVSSNSINVLYAPTAPITQIDGQSIATDITTENYEVNVEYLYGGEILTNESGEYLTNESDFVLTNDKGVFVDVIAYALDRGVNSVQITGLTDDFGNSFSTTTEQCTKIPHLIYDGLTTVDEETYGTTYDGALALIVDQGAPYETNVTPSEAPYAFTSGDYRDYNFTASYTYPTGQSNSVAVVISYVPELSQLVVPKIIRDSSFAFQIFDSDPQKLYDVKNKQYSTITGTGIYIVPDRPTYTDNTIQLDLGYPQNDPRGNRSVRMSANGNGVWLNGTENIMRQGESWSISFWFEPGPSAFRTVVCKHGEDGANAGFSHWAEINIENNTIYAYFGGTSLNIGTGSNEYNNCVTISCEYTGGTNYRFNTWINGSKTISNADRNLTNLRDVNRRVAAFARTSNDSIDSTFTNSMTDKSVSNLVLYDYAISSQKAGQIYRNQDNSIILGFSGDSNLGEAKWDTGYVTKLLEEMVDKCYNVKAYAVHFGGLTSYDFGPTAMVKAPWLATYGQTRPDVQSAISADRLVYEYGCDILIPAESSNISNNNYLYQEFDNGNASSGELLHNVGQYKVLADANNIIMTPLSPLPVNSTALKRNVKWSIVQKNFYDALKSVYPFTLDSITWATEGSDYLPKVGYSRDVQHFEPLYHSDFATNSLIPHFGEIARNLIENNFPNLNTFVPVLLPTNIKDGDYVEFVVGDQINFDFKVYNGDVYGCEMKSQTETLTAGSNTITLSYTDTFGNTGTQDITVTYGPSLNAVLGDWPLDAIVSDTLDDITSFENDLRTINSPVITGGRLDLDGDDSSFNAPWAKTKTDSTAWFAYEQPWGCMGFIEVRSVGKFLQSIMAKGGNSHAHGIYLDATGKIVMNYHNSTFVPTTETTYTLAVNTRVHFAWQTYVNGDDGSGNTVIRNELYINGTLQGNYDSTIYGETVNFQNVSIGAVNNSADDDVDGNRHAFDGFFDNFKYRNGLWTPTEILNIYNAEV